MANNFNKSTQTNWTKENAIEAEKESLEKFNEVTQKVKPENQNQTHNVRQEAISKINQKR